MTVSGSAKFTPTFESVPCDNCGSCQSTFLFSGPDREHDFHGNFPVVECVQCGWLRQNPRPIATDLVQYYPDDYNAYAKAIEDERGFWNRWDRRYGMIKRCRSVERWVGKGRVLEVGCGTGIFLNEMRRRGWSVVGVEPNLYASNYARTRFGMEIFTGTLEEFSAPPESFDVIALWNVLEHLPTPAQDMRRMARALKKDGLLVMGIPNLESLDRRLFKECWRGWELPRHLYFFSRSGLETFLNQQGLKIIATRCPAGNYYAFLLSLHIYLRERFKTNWRQMDMLIQIGRQFPIRLCTFPVFWLIDALKASSLLTYYARKL